MTNSETNSRAGEDVSPVAEVKTAVTGFMKDFKAFQSDIKARFQQQEEKMTMMERKSQSLKRPVLSQGADMQQSS